MKRNSSKLAGAIVLSIILSGWGYTGHYEISERTSESLENKIEGFENWMSFIAAHSSDPDYRKSWVKAEFPKHFIDIDNYPEFTANGSINHHLDSLTVKYGEAFITEQGTLPWTTLATFDSLSSCFKRKDWHNAKLWAADLSHYVGDGHMPLHATHNYDGQETGNKGIHSRYESKMVTAFANAIAGTIPNAEYINNVPSFIFNYLYQSNRLCDSIFSADNRAQQLAGNTDSPEYFAELWKNTASLTADQFNRASSALGCLIYTAWIQAGSPNLKNSFLENDKYDCEITSISENKDAPIRTINYQVFNEGDYKIDIRNSDGGTAMKVGSWEKKPGNYSIDVDLSSLTGETYLVVMSCANFASTMKLIKK